VKLAREQSHEDFRLVIVGPPGRAEESVRALARNTDPNGAWIERRVNVSDAELDREYDSAFVLVQPSSGEGYGLPVGEAAARGLPAVHSGAGSLSEIAPGAVVQPEGARSYSDAIVALLDADTYEIARSAGLAAARRLNVRSYATAVDRAISLATT
jgi:Glycosyl transferases group 1